MVGLPGWGLPGWEHTMIYRPASGLWSMVGRTRQKQAESIRAVARVRLSPCGRRMSLYCRCKVDAERVAA